MGTQANGRAATSEYTAKFYLIADSIHMNRNDGALAKVSTSILPEESMGSAENRAMCLLSAKLRPTAAVSSRIEHSAGHGFALARQPGIGLKVWRWPSLAVPACGGSGRSEADHVYPGRGSNNSQTGVSGKCLEQEMKNFAHAVVSSLLSSAVMDGTYWFLRA